MHRPNPETIVFLAPGLVPQVGNLLLTSQGHALHLDAPEHGTRARAAILTAAERGGDSLRLLRFLLGEPGPGLADLAATWSQLGELLRVPVREAGFTIELQQAPAGRAHLVELGDFAPLFVEAVRVLVGALPDGARGTVLGNVAGAGEAVVQLRFRRAADRLPFPVDTGAAAHRVTAAGERFGWRGRCRATADGLELAVGLAGATAEA